MVSTSSPFRAAVLHAPNTPLKIEQVVASPLSADDVQVRIKAAGLCHTDLEVMEGQLRYPLPIVLGHEASGIVEAVGSSVTSVRPGDHVVLSWNPHCGHCFYCDHDTPILCETYLKNIAQALPFGGRPKLALTDGTPLQSLMFLGAFSQICIVSEQQAIAVPQDIPFENTCLIGCAVMTGIGAALNIAEIAPGDTAMVIGCGAVGLAAIQGARMAGADNVIAVDLNPAKEVLAKAMGATHFAPPVNAISLARSLTNGRGVDVVLESAGASAAFRLSAEAARPGGEIVWLGKMDVDAEASFRWGSLMGEKRIRRSSYGGARPARDFPLLAQAYLDGKLLLEPLISRRIALEDINAGFFDLKNGKTIRSVVMF